MLPVRSVNAFPGDRYMRNLTVAEIYTVCSPAELRYWCTTPAAGSR
jgi:hypothetical protein